MPVLNTFVKALTKTLATGLAVTLAVTTLGAALLFAVYSVPNPGEDAPVVIVSVDRTAWNLLGLNKLTYVRKLRLAGVRPRLVNFKDAQVSAAEVIGDTAFGLVLTGGGDVDAARYGGDSAVVRGANPARDAFELALLDLAAERSLPVLGLCRGAQLINVHRAGTLGDFRDDAIRFPAHRNLTLGHDVRLVTGSALATIFGQEELKDVTTWHGQHVDRPGRGLTISARTADGTPEAIEDVAGKQFVVGVQWHAEMPPWDTSQAPLFEAFAKAVGHRAAQPGRQQQSALRE